MARTGRTPKPAGDRKSATMRFRTREGLREQLEFAALASGRSASEEAEFRLMRSFDRDDLRQIIRDEIRAAMRDEREVERQRLRDSMARQVGQKSAVNIGFDQTYADIPLIGLPGPLLQG